MITILLAAYSIAITIVSCVLLSQTRRVKHLMYEVLSDWKKESDFMFESYLALLKRHEPEHAEFCLRKVAEFTVDAKLRDISGAKS